VPLDQGPLLRTEPAPRLLLEPRPSRLGLEPPAADLQPLLLQVAVDAVVEGNAARSGTYGVYPGSSG
jgi:hypothetical protein